ncbi:MAG: polysaccharide pyruvyl transferase family protein [Anaerovoracaceae bacterium]
MKHGLLMHKSTKNLGDDIQSYAIDCFLPKVDYYLTREKLDDFRPEDEEPVAVVMSAWWMWEKWNWPPSKYIIPKFVGFHYSDNYKAKQAGCPVDYDFLTGIGADYLNAYGPIGARDLFTEQKLKDNDVDSYFSGCITITLPEQPKKEVEKEYICLVDLDKRVERKIIKQLEGTNIEVKVMTHDIDYSKNHSTWEKRKGYVEEVLGIYQNAKCVITRRLHCALPCMAMGVKTLLVIHTLESIRFIPYYDWLHVCTPKMYLEGKFEYDLNNPPENKTVHMPVREELTETVRTFVAEMEDNEKPLDKLVKTKYSEEEKKQWRVKMMRETINKWIEIINRDRAEMASYTDNGGFVSRLKKMFIKKPTSLLMLNESMLQISSYEQIMQLANGTTTANNIDDEIKLMKKTLRAMLSIARKDFPKLKELRKSSVK